MSKVRLTFQAAAFAAVVYVAVSGGDPERWCPAGGMASLAGQLTAGRMSCAVTALNIFLFGAVVLAVALCGRLFCSFICPLGFTAEWLSRAGARLGLARTLSGAPDALLRGVKFVLLFFVLRQTLATSELFCKRFEPYYAVASGLNVDVVRWAAGLSLAALVLGGLAGRMAWCKYLCFFGAAQNALATVTGVAAGGVVLVVARALGVAAPLPWAFGALCLAGWAGELLGQRWLPLVKVRRSAASCTGCRLCDRACPQGIAVSTADRVVHPDCHLCGECVARCPAKGALGWSPAGAGAAAPALIVLLVVGAVLATGAWGDRPAFATVRFVPDGLVADGRTVAVFEQSGVKNVKCYGSSMALLGRLGRVASGGVTFNPGILGAETYVATKTFRVFYDPRLVAEDDVRRAIFRAGRTVQVPVSSLDPATRPTVDVLRVGVYGVVDDVDVSALAALLGRSPAVYGLLTEWGEPIVATVFHDKAAVTPAALRALIEERSEVTTYGQTLRCEFKADGDGTPLPPTPTRQFQEEFFPSFDKTLYTTATTSVVEARLEGVDDPRRRSDLGWLAAHLGRVPGVVRVRTLLRDQPVVWVHGVPGRLEPAAVEAALRAPELSQERGGALLTRPNPFRLVEPPRALDPAEAGSR